MTPTINIDFYSLVLFLGGCQGLVFALLLLFKPQAKRAINVYLAFILISLSFETLHQFLLQTQYIYQFKYLVGFILPFDALIGISLYWYVRVITQPEKDHSAKRVLAHYSIFFCCVILSFPYWFMGFDDKLSLMTSGIVSSDWSSYVYYSTLAQVPIKIISFIVYLILSIRLLLQHKQRIRAIFSNTEKITLNWLSLLLIVFVLGLINGLAVLLFFQDFPEATQVMGYMGVFSIAAAFYIGVMGLLQPVIYLRDESSFLENDVPAEQNTSKNKTETEIDIGKYKKSALSDTDMQRIASKLDAQMKTQQLYLDSDLTLPKLAASIAISSNYLSQTLNIHYQCNFFDYVNRLRVEYAQSLFCNSEKENFNVLDVALESGFNSRSTFYSAFKNIVGMTPAQFKKSHRS